MRRFHLWELHEEPWYPIGWRNHFQLMLGRIGCLFQPLESFGDKFESFLEKVQPKSILELCSGSGENSVSIYARLVSSLTSPNKPKLILSDLYPNIRSYSKLKEEYSGLIDYHAEALDCLAIPKEASDAWMMLESLHHFRPGEVRTILRNATENADGFAAAETTQRSWTNMAFTIFVAPILSVLIAAFLVKPIRFSNIFWGLLIPVVPFTMVFDAAVSNLRSYTVEELEEMIDSVRSAEFAWEVGTTEMPRLPGLKVTYVFGWRKDKAKTSS